jgi:hypothetical protein
VSGTKFALILSISIVGKVFGTRIIESQEDIMRKTKFFEMQARKAPELTRLRQLEQENDLLKLLYVDLLQKSVAIKDRMDKRAHVW